MVTPLKMFTPHLQPKGAFGCVYYGVIMTKQAKLLASLQTGTSLTAKQITSTFGLKDPVASVRNLRNQGHCVYANDAKLSDGTKTTKYRIGTPTKRMVALASRTVGAFAFTRG
jgi:predicted transcriptional regulator